MPRFCLPLSQQLFASVQESRFVSMGFALNVHVSKPHCVLKLSINECSSPPEIRKHALFQGVVP